MHIVLTVLGSHGDVLPFIALGVELRRRGHTVVLISSQPFAAHAAQAGLAFEAVATTAQYDAIFDRHELWRGVRGLKYLFAAADDALKPSYDLIMRHYQRGATVVVASVLAMAARIAQDRWDVPVVTVHLAPFLMRTAYDVPRLPGLRLPGWLPRPAKKLILDGLDDYMIDPLCAPGINRLRSELGLAPVRSIMTWWNSPKRLLALFPSWFAPPQPDWPSQTVQAGFLRADTFGDIEQLTPELRGFIADGEPPVAFTYGSAMRHGRRFFETSVALCSQAGRRGVLVSPDRAQVPDQLPNIIRYAAYAPFSHLLPSCAALVHHGGIGTVAAALATGTPQLIVPIAFDHFDEAARIGRLGAGRSLRRFAYRPWLAARVVNELIGSDRMAKACAHYAARLAADDPLTAACDTIERAL